MNEQQLREIEERLADARVRTFDKYSVLPLLQHIRSMEAELREARRDAERYRFWRQHQYQGLLDVDEFCDENSPQAIHFDRLTDAAMEKQHG